MSFPPVSFSITSIVLASLTGGFFSCRTVHPLPERPISISIDAPFTSVGIDTEDGHGRRMTRVMATLLEERQAVLGFRFYRNFEKTENAPTDFVVKGRLGYEQSEFFDNPGQKSYFFTFGATDTRTGETLFQTGTAHGQEVAKTLWFDPLLPNSTNYASVGAAVSVQAISNNLFPYRHLLNPRNEGNPENPSLALEAYLEAENKADTHVARTLTNLLNNCLVYRQRTFTLHQPLADQTRPDAVVRYPFDYLPNYRLPKRKKVVGTYTLSGHLARTGNQYLLTLHFTDQNKSTTGEIQLDKTRIDEGNYAEAVRKLGPPVQQFLTASTAWNVYGQTDGGR